MSSLREWLMTGVVGTLFSEDWINTQVEEYLAKLEDELQRIYLIPDSDRDTWNADARKLWFDGFNRARETTLKFLRNGETE